METREKSTILDRKNKNNQETLKLQDNAQLPINYQ